MLTLSVKAIVERTKEPIKEFITAEKSMDKWQVEIDEEAIRLIAVHTPVAHDLRLLLMIGRLSLELERIGDLARNMCKFIKIFLARPYLDLPEELPRMVEQIHRMLNDSFESFKNEDAQLAIETMNRDDTIDNMDKDLFTSIVPEMVQKSDQTRVVALVLLSRSLERIGDHVANMCEQIVYLVEAKDIRHTV